MTALAAFTFLRPLALLALPALAALWLVLRRGRGLPAHRAAPDAGAQHRPRGPRRAPRPRPANPRGDADGARRRRPGVAAGALAAFTFLRPAVLLALPLLAGLWLLLRRRGGAEGARTPHIAPHLLAALTIGRAARRRISAPDLLVPAAMLMAIGAAGPAWRPAPSPFVTETAPLVVAPCRVPSASISA